MLSVAAASTGVHCSETPKSSSSHSGLANPTGWKSDHTPLKRRQSQQRDLTSDYGFSSEITLTLVSADANGYKRHRTDSEKSLNSGVTLRYKDPKTMAPTEKMLDNDMRHSFDTSRELNVNSLIKKPVEEPEPSQNSSVTGILEKISSEITIYPKQESEKQSLHTGASTSNKSANQLMDNSRTVFKVSQEVDIISPKSSQSITQKCGSKVAALLEAAKKDVPEDNVKPETSVKLRVRSFDTNNNPSQSSWQPRLESSRMHKAVQHIVGLKSTSIPTPIRAAIDENKLNFPSRSRERLNSNEPWNADIFGHDSTMQSISSSMSFPETLYNFGEEFSADNPYFVAGFPNPPGENRCWVNATIHALFALPFTNSLDSLNLSECTPLMKTLISIQTLWRKGESEKHKIHNLLRKFKEELIVLDESYPSERQQDVSEFLMKLLNHLKAYFEKLVSGDAKIQEIENVPENPQDHRKSKTTPDSTKRPPLVELRRNSNLFEPGTSPKSQKVERLPNSTETSRENAESEATKNPIDEYFLLPIVDQYVCKGCSEKKQKQVDNLVVFIQVPPESKDVPVNVEDAIARNFTTEERRVTCENCKHEFQDVRTAFSSHPKILTVHVHRYGVGEHGTRKISNALSIPEKLVLKPSLMIEGFEADEVYKPVCIISHVGENVDCGHYTSYVEHEGHWYHYNDMSVFPMTSCEVFEAAETTAYLIFFVNINLLEKQNTDLSKTHFN